MELLKQIYLRMLIMGHISWYWRWPPAFSFSITPSSVEYGMVKSVNRSKVMGFIGKYICDKISMYNKPVEQLQWWWWMKYYFILIMPIRNIIKIFLLNNRIQFELWHRRRFSYKTTYFQLCSKCYKYVFKSHLNKKYTLELK